MFYREIIKCAPYWSAVTPSMPARLDGHFEMHHFEPHEIIHQKDSPLTRVGLLVEGTFRVVNELENGSVFMIELNDAPSFVGEVTLLSGNETTSVTIEAVIPCSVAFLPTRLFSEWLDEDSHLLRYVSGHVARKLYSSSYHRGERHFYSARYVILRYILDNLTYENAAASVRRTRQQMSEEIGMAVNTINRNLLSLRQDGLISIQHGKIILTPGQVKDSRNALSVLISENRNGMKNAEARKKNTKKG